MAVRYENLTPAQADDDQKLRRFALQTDPRAFGTTVAEFDRHSTNDLAQLMAQTLENGGRYIIAYEDGEPVGMATFIRLGARMQKKAHIGIIVGVYVTPSHRGRGVARGMMTRLLAFARTQPGIQVIQLAVVTDNEAARSLYESLGFGIWGTEPCAMQDDDGCVDQYHMALRV